MEQSLLHVGVRSDPYYRPQRQAEAVGLLIEQRGRWQRAERRADVGTRSSSHQSTLSTQLGRTITKLISAKCSTNVVSPLYVVKLFNCGDAACASDPHQGVVPLVVRAKRSVFRAFSAVLVHAGFRVVIEQTISSYLPAAGRSSTARIGTVRNHPQPIAENPTDFCGYVESGDRARVKRLIVGFAESALRRALHRRRDSTPKVSVIPSARLGQ